MFTEKLYIFFKDFSFEATKGTLKFKILLDDKDSFINADLQRLREADTSGTCIASDIVSLSLNDIITINEDGINVNYKVLEFERIDSKLTKIYLNKII